VGSTVLIQSSLTRPPTHPPTHPPIHPPTGKDGRKINFEQFLSGLSLIAIKKYPNSDPVTAFSLLCSKHVFAVLDSPPATMDPTSRVTLALLGSDSGGEGAVLMKGGGNGTIAGSANKAGGIFDKLTSMDSYTGVYKARFDGGGGGINGHHGDVSGQIRDLSSMTRPEMARSKFMDV
jgi:hypothetical protein